MNDQFFADVQENETIRIISGEAFPEIIDDLQEPLHRAFTDKKAVIKVIVGPIVCITDEYSGDRRNGNPYLRLARSSVLTLYPAPVRQMRHLKILGERKVLIEHYHESLASYEERKAVTIEDSSVAQKCAYDFDVNIEIFRSQAPEADSPKRLLCLTKDEIVRIKEAIADPDLAVNRLGIDSMTFHSLKSILNEPGKLYDFITYSRGEKVLRQIGLFQQDMVLNCPFG